MPLHHTTIFRDVRFSQVQSFFQNASLIKNIAYGMAEKTKFSFRCVIAEMYLLASVLQYSEGVPVNLFPKSLEGPVTLQDDVS